MSPIKDKNVPYFQYMKCPKCGYENKEDAIACNLCGEALKRTGDLEERREGIIFETEPTKPRFPCSNHPMKSAEGLCEVCKKDFCAECLQGATGCGICITCRTKSYTKAVPRRTKGYGAQSLMKGTIKRPRPTSLARLLRSRVLSGMVALFYLGLAIASGNSGLICGIVLCSIGSLVCIWFSDTLGRYTGFVGFYAPRITRKTPGIFVAFGGWLLLLLPWIIVIIWIIRGNIKLK